MEEKEYGKKGKISYDEIVLSAFPNANYRSSAYTVTYSNGPKQNPKGSMGKRRYSFCN